MVLMEIDATMYLVALASETFLVVPLPLIIFALVALGLVGLGLLWQKGRRVEAFCLLNTVLLIIVIILLLMLF